MSHRLRYTAPEKRHDRHRLPPTPSARREYTGLTLREVMLLVPARTFTPWTLAAPPVEPSVYLTEALSRFASFDLVGSEMAKRLLIDAVCAECAKHAAP